MVQVPDAFSSEFPPTLNTVKSCLAVAERHALKVEEDAQEVMAAAAATYADAKDATEAIRCAKDAVDELSFKAIAHDFLDLVKRNRDKHDDSSDETGTKRKRVTLSD